MGGRAAKARKFGEAILSCFGSHPRFVFVRAVMHDMNLCLHHEVSVCLYVILSFYTYVSIYLFLHISTVCVYCTYE